MSEMQSDQSRVTPSRLDPPRNVAVPRRVRIGTGDGVLLDVTCRARPRVLMAPPLLGSVQQNFRGTLSAHQDPNVFAGGCCLMFYQKTEKLPDKCSRPPQ
jgi:hypothetical protein